MDNAPAPTVIGQITVVADVEVIKAVPALVDVTGHAVWDAAAGDADDAQEEDES